MDIITMKIPDPKLFRENVVAKFAEKVSSARNLETGIFNWTVQEATARKIVKKWNNPSFVLIYTDRFRSIWNNLSADLIAKINNKELKAQTVAFMTHQELKPQQWEEAIQRKIIRDKSKYEVNIEATSDSFVCRKCHKNKTNHYQMQTRSADEPMTTFVKCLNCDARWRC